MKLLKLPNSSSFLPLKTSIKNFSDIPERKKQIFLPTTYIKNLWKSSLFRTRRNFCRISLKHPPIFFTVFFIFCPRITFTQRPIHTHFKTFLNRKILRWKSRRGIFSKNFSIPRTAELQLELYPSNQHPPEYDQIMTGQAVLLLVEHPSQTNLFELNGHHN